MFRADDFQGAPLFHGFEEVYDRSRHRSFAQKRHSSLKRNTKLFNRQLFLKAAQNLHLIQADIDKANLDRCKNLNEQNKISAYVAFSQKTIDFEELYSQYQGEKQRIKDGYADKVNFYKQRVGIQRKARIGLLREIIVHAGEAEREAEELKKQEIEYYKKNEESRTEELRKQLMNAQRELDSLHSLKDKATIAKERINLLMKQNANASKKNAPVLSDRIIQQINNPPKKEIKRGIFLPKPK